jgi:DNA-binding NarL/FixJ family response regulator
MAKCIKVLIAEDHDIVRAGLKLLISADPQLEIAGETNNGPAAVRLAQKLRPDVVLMDLAMPKGNGLDASRDISLHVPATKILVLSAYQDEELVQRVIEAGASGYMTKRSAADELLSAIRQVGQGKFYCSPSIAGRLKARRTKIIPGSVVVPKPPSLTRREKEVLELIARGQPNKQIASNLGVSIKTVEKHRQAVMDKLGIHDIAGLTRYALSKGMLPSPATPQQQELPLAEPRPHGTTTSTR